MNVLSALFRRIGRRNRVQWICVDSSSNSTNYSTGSNVVTLTYDGSSGGVPATLSVNSSTGTRMECRCPALSSKGEP